MEEFYLQGCKDKTAKERLIDECGERALNLYLFFMELNEKQADINKNRPKNYYMRGG